eukprot:g48436.t1
MNSRSLTVNPLELGNLSIVTQTGTVSGFSIAKVSVLELPILTLLKQTYGVRAKHSHAFLCFACPRILVSPQSNCWFSLSMWMEMIVLSVFVLLVILLLMDADCFCIHEVVNSADHSIVIIPISDLVKQRVVRLWNELPEEVVDA